MAALIKWWDLKNHGVEMDFMGLQVCLLYLLSCLLELKKGAVGNTNVTYLALWFQTYFEEIKADTVWNSSRRSEYLEEWAAGCSQACLPGTSWIFSAYWREMSCYYWWSNSLGGCELTHSSPQGFRNYHIACWENNRWTALAHRSSNTMPFAAVPMWFSRVMCW